MEKRHTILVVDDEPDVVRSVHDLLRLEYKVLMATSAEEGMKLMEDQEVHVVMTDQRMPFVSGVEFLRKVRGEYPEATRLLFTGYADIRAVIDAINQGNVYRYITKPWDPEELQTIIREAAERYELIIARQTLTADLQKKNQELEQANAQLRDANSLKAAFIQVASHELRTPLAILLGMVKLAQRGKEIPQPLADWLERIDVAADRLQHLVEQLINMISTEGSVLPLNRETVDAAALVHQAAEDVRPFVELRHQELKVEIVGDLSSASLDTTKIRDSLNHLLLNAIKFTPDNGHISISAERLADRSLSIKVADDGVGINEACLKRLFEPFFTGFDVSHHSSGHFEYLRQGLGLGLSVVKRFVELHGGSASVASEVNGGTIVTIVLPESAGAVAAP